MSDSKINKAANELCDAWENLPGGYHSDMDVEKWLEDIMKPAMDELRNQLGRKIPTK